MLGKFARVCSPSPPVFSTIICRRVTKIELVREYIGLKYLFVILTPNVTILTLYIIKL